MSVLNHVCQNTCRKNTHREKNSLCILTKIILGTIGNIYPSLSSLYEVSPRLTDFVAAASWSRELSVPPGGSEVGKLGPALFLRRPGWWGWLF